LNGIADPADDPTGLTPRWVSWALVVGAIVLVGWAWFVHGFLGEPSATGRVRLLLVAWIGYSGLAALLGLAGAAAAMREVPGHRRLAAIAATAMTITGIGAIAGVPALLGIFWSRHAGSP